MYPYYALPNISDELLMQDSESRNLELGSCQLHIITYSKEEHFYSVNKQSYSSEREVVTRFL